MDSAQGCAIFCGPRTISAGTLAGRPGTATAARGVFSVWRWAAALHRARIRDAGECAGDCRHRAEIQVSIEAGISGGAGAVGDAAAQVWDCDEDRGEVDDLAFPAQ